MNILELDKTLLKDIKTHIKSSILKYIKIVDDMTKEYEKQMIYPLDILKIYVDESGKYGSLKTSSTTFDINSIEKQSFMQGRDEYGNCEDFGIFHIIMSRWHDHLTNQTNKNPYNFDGRDLYNVEIRCSFDCGSCTDDYVECTEHNYTNNKNLLKNFYLDQIDDIKIFKFYKTDELSCNGVYLKNGNNCSYKPY